MVCSSLVGAALALAVQPAAAGMLDDPGAPEAPVAASYATIIGGSFEVDGSSSTIPHALTASGSAPPAYSVKTSVKSFSKTLSLPDFTSLSVSTGVTTDTAASMGQQGDTATATASSSIQSASASVTNPLLSGKLSLSGTEIKSTAEFVASTKAAPLASGTTTIAGLVVDMSLLGLGVHNYTGTPKPNMVLFKSKDGSVIVYLNRQTKTLAPASDQPDATATSITVRAVDVHLTDAMVAGQSISGDIEIGISYAE